MEGVSKTMHLYVIRHGESLGNIRESIDPNCGLSPRGQQQVKRIPEFFKDKTVDRIFCSPLRRTIHTTTPLADQQHKIITLVPEMSEHFPHHATSYRDYSWESCEVTLSSYPNIEWISRHPMDRPWYPKWPEEETDVDRRVNAFFDHDLVPLLGTDSHVAVFGHGATTESLMRRLHPENPYFPLTSETNAVIFEYELAADGSLVYSKANTEHLGELVSSVGYKA